MVEQAIRDVTRRFVETCNRGDAAAAADFYTDDAKLLPPNVEMVTGKQAIEDFWKVAMAMGIRNMSLEPIEMWGGPHH